MKNKPLHTPGASEEPPKENDDEDNNGVWTNGTNPNLSTERCPICLNFLTQDVGFPENCYHAFCVNCILRWSETSTSCPVDRKPFQIVYKINPAAGCTKIQVKTRRQRERCCCNGNPLYTLCCAKTKIRYRTDSSKELISHNVLFNKSDSFVSKEEKQASESELKTLNRHEPCYTSDFVSLSQQNAQLDLPLIGLHDVSEDGELDLIKQKREGLKYLRPTSAARRSDLMSFSGETEALSVSTTAFSLVDYIPPLCNFSIRNQGFSKRTCVHSGAQEGTEKKAASGASNGRGSRRKASQSSTRRRSTRNSKSEDMSHLPSSPKSNTSDRDSPDCNNSSANVSSADHTVKTPPKQRKRVPKKRSQARKRLRSATRTQEQSSGSKENSADESEEQLVKTRKISKKDAFKTADSDVDSIAEHSVEVQEPVDCRPSPSASPIQSQSDENTPASPPVRTEPFSDEKTLDSSSQNEQESDMEEEPSSQNNSVLMEKTSPTSPASVNLGNSACDHSALSPFADKSPSNSDEEASDFKKPQSSSEGENCSSSPVPKGDISDHTESPLSQTARRKGASDEEDSSFEKPYESDTEGNEKPLSKYSHESNRSDSSSSDEDDLSPKNDRPAEFLRNQSVLTEPDDLSDSRNGQLSPEPPLLENALNTCMDEKNSLSDQENPPELDDSPDFKVGENKINSGSAEAGRQEVPSFEKHNLESAVQESSCLPAEKYSMDDEAEGSSRNVQEAELKSSVEGKEITIEADESCKRSPEIQAAPTALQHSRPCVINSHSNDGFHDAKNNDTEGSSMPLDVTVSASLQTSHKSSNLRVDDGSLSDHRKELCDQDNNESIAMECESDSDHSESEIEQQAETDKIKGAESGAEVSVIKEEAKPQSAETVCVNEKTNEEAPKKESRPRRSRFHSPSTTWSPQKTDVKERQRSRSRGRDSPGKRMSRSRSRDRDGSRDRGGQWKGRSRERWHRRHSRSKSKSRSRSRSPSRPAARNKGPPPERNEMGCGSPPWREKRQYDNWRSPRGNERYRKHEQEKPSENFRRDRHDISRDSSEPYKDSSNQNDYPDWVAEKIKSEARGKSSTRSRVSPRGSHWDSNNYSQGESWNKSESMDWQSPRGRGGRGRGRGGFRGAFGYGEQSENRWNSRPTFSGNSNSSGPESRFPEQRNYRTKYEQEPYDSPADRSGWSSASSWAVRKTLPADVQNYYSKRGRSQAGSQPAWPKHDESPDQALKVDQPIKDQVSQPAEAPQMPVNLIPPQMNVVQPQMNQPPPQPMNMFPYSVSVPPPPLVSIQHNPYSIHAQLPMHIHPGLPIQVPVQVSAPASVSQGLPPPPPPPPPSQQVNYVTSQPEGKLMQVNPGATHAGNNYSAPLLPAPAATIGIVGTVLGPNAGIVASSTHSKTPHFSVKPPVRKDFITVEATADGSKKEKKLQIQERAAHEVKMAIKQYYQNKDITKDEYKEIVKKAVDKVCHSKSGEVDSAKVANLIKAYVDKYKHSRKKE